MKKDYKKYGWYRIAGCIVLAVILCYFVLCISLKPKIREERGTQGNCKIYYILNDDGMKGLGHSILLLEDEEGCGTVFSFNGMQRSLGEALLGKAGVGKMSVGDMSKEELQAFLNTGELCLEGDQLQDNYDIALYRNITEEEYAAILEGTEIYIETGREYEELYIQYAAAEDKNLKEEYKRQLEQMGANNALPLYRIYTHNCDHAARLIIARVDDEMKEYNQKTNKITPGGNLKAFAKSTNSWGVMRLGESTFPESVLEFLMIF